VELCWTRLLRLLYVVRLRREYRLILPLKNVEMPFMKLVQDYQKDGPRTRYGVLMRRILRGRRFGVASSGCIGIFPAAARIGDQIYIALGSELPLLIRPVPERDNYSRLVGTCYVPGLMGKWIAIK
jgi:hypothetical protein